MASKFFCSGDETTSSSSEGASLEHPSDGEQVTQKRWEKELMIETEKVLLRNMHDDTSSASVSVDLGHSSNPSRYTTSFEEIAPIGKGSYGAVYRCRNLFEDKEYAVKKIALTIENNIEKTCREVKALASLRHKHVVRYYQAWTDEDTSWLQNVKGGELLVRGKEAISTLYIQMELCPKTLANCLRGNSKESTWCLFRQIVKGLSHIHKNGIIHRDLSKRNVFIDANNNVKIGDFGLAKFKSTTGNGSPVSGIPELGNPTYRAPEMAGENPQITSKVDIYSLGWVFLDMFVSFPTNEERDLAHADIINKGIFPASLDELELSLFRELTSISPHDRPSAADLLDRKLPWLKPMEKELEVKNAVIEEQKKKIEELERKFVALLAELKATDPFTDFLHTLS